MPNLTEKQQQLLRGASEWIGVSSEVLAGRIYDILEKTRRLPVYKHQLKQRANALQREVTIFHRHLRRAVTDQYQFADQLDNAEDNTQQHFAILHATLYNTLRIKPADEQHPCLPLVLETATGYLFAEAVVYGMQKSKEILRTAGLNVSLIVTPTRMQEALHLFLRTLAGEFLWQRICTAASTDTVRQAVTECYVKMLNTTFQIP